MAATYEIELEEPVKVTSYGEQFSVPATSRYPATPVAELGEGSGQVSPKAEPDLKAVNSTLLPIEDHLNESAEIAMMPSPPINSPAGPSPQPSIIVRNRARCDILGEFGDMIGEVLIDSRHRRVDPDSVSNQSVRSFDPNDSEDGSTSEPVNSDTSDSGEETGSSSPRPNPLIAEYKKFIVEHLPEGQTSEAAIQSAAAMNGHVPIPPVRAESFSTEGGVTEKSTWADEAEEGFCRALNRLEQLVLDETKDMGSRAEYERYIYRLTRVLEAADRRFPLNIEAKAKAKFQDGGD